MAYWSASVTMTFTFTPVSSVYFSMAASYAAFSSGPPRNMNVISLSPPSLPPSPPSLHAVSVSVPATAAHTAPAMSLFLFIVLPPISQGCARSRSRRDPVWGWSVRVVVDLSCVRSTLHLQR